MKWFYQWGSFESKRIWYFVYFFWAFRRPILYIFSNILYIFLQIIVCLNRNIWLYLLIWYNSHIPCDVNVEYDSLKLFQTTMMLFASYHFPFCTDLPSSFPVEASSLFFYILFYILCILLFPLSPLLTYMVPFYFPEFSCSSMFYMHMWWFLVNGPQISNNIRCLSFWVWNPLLSIIFLGPSSYLNISWFHFWYLSSIP